MSQTTLYGLIAGVALVLAGAALIWKGEQMTGGLLIAAGLAALGLGKTASDAPKVAVLTPLFLISLFLAGPAHAQDAVSLLDVTHRAHVTVNAGAMFLTEGADWSGASAGGTVLYNLHPKLSLFGGYDHGFPVNDVDAHLNLFRAIASVRIHPNAFVGFGYAWFGNGIEGGVTHLLVTKQVMPHLALAGVYAHVFARGDLEDFEYARVYLNYHLLGKE